MAHHDIEELKRRYPPSAIAARYTTLAKDGDEQRGLCPFHKEKTPSFTVLDHKGWSHCFGCGWHGDILQMVMDMHGLQPNEIGRACEIIAGAPAPDALRPAAEREEKPDLYAALKPAAATPEAALPSAGRAVRCWNPKRGRWVTYRPSMVFPYRDAKGAILGIVLRVDLTEKTAAGEKAKKLTPCLRFIESPEGDGYCWSHMPFDRPRPLYGLDELAARPGPVIWVEGEKSADAARRLLGLLVIAAPGGGKGIAHVDWSPLKGRPLLVWGDADKEGERTVLGWDKDERHHPGVCELAHAAGAGPIHYLSWDKSKAEGWDAADALAARWPGHKFWSWANPRKVEWKPGAKPRAKPAEHAAVGVGRTEETTASAADGGPPPSGSYAAPAEPTPTEHPFRILGHDRGVFHYQPHGVQQIVGLKPEQHTQANLVYLAPSEHWERFFPSPRGARAPFNVYAVQNALFRAAERLPVFSIDALRGVGAWIDDGRVAIHLGDRVLVDGEAAEPSEVKTTFVYEKGAPMALKASAEPAADAAAERFAKVCQRFGWETPLSGMLLAGWCVIAPVCGALHWRPHIWVRGPSGSGKSTIKDRVVEPMLGPLAVWRDGSTTEANLRQTIGRAARPVGIDEAESEDKIAAIRMQQVLQLSRISSSGGKIGKGGKDGIAIEYMVRSCFAYFSINPSVTHYADETRIAQLALRVSHDDDAQDRFADLAGEVAELITPDFCAAMFARTVRYLPVLLANIRIFTAAVAKVLKSNRAADQIGTMLAGLYLCHRTTEVGFDAAVEWVQSQDWREHTAIEAANDERRLLTRIATTRRRVTPESGAAVRELTIGELVLIAARRLEVEKVTEKDARRELGRIGIRLPSDDVRFFTIANKSPELERLLQGTPWAAGWRNVLRAFPMAAATEPHFYAPGLIERGTHLELDLLTSFLPATPAQPTTPPPKEAAA